MSHIVTSCMPGGSLTPASSLQKLVYTNTNSLQRCAVTCWAYLLRHSTVLWIQTVPGWSWLVFCHL